MSRPRYSHYAPILGLGILAACAAQTMPSTPPGIPLLEACYRIETIPDSTVVRAGDTTDETYGRIYDVHLTNSTYRQVFESDRKYMRLAEREEFETHLTQRGRWYVRSDSLYIEFADYGWSESAVFGFPGDTLRGVGQTGTHTGYAQYFQSIAVRTTCVPLRQDGT